MQLWLFNSIDFAPPFVKSLSVEPGRHVLEIGMRMSVCLTRVHDRVFHPFAVSS